MISQKERDGVMFLIGRYRSILYSAGYIPKQHERRIGLPHIHWMLVELQSQLIADNPKFDDGKVGRWIGYIQYALAYGELVDSTHEADISRPFFSRDP